MKRRTFVIILIVAAAMRLYQIGAANFWYDEGFTVIVSRLPLKQMFSALAGDVHPPLYYLITWAIAHLGLTAEWAFRLPSALFTLVSLYLTWQTTSAMNFGADVQAGSSVLMAVMPLSIHYAQEARMYALLQMLVLAAVLFVLRGRWWLVALSVTAMLYTHNYGLFYGAALAGVALLTQPRAWRRWAPALGAPLVAWLPWANVLLTQMHDVAGGYWILPVNAGSVLYSVYQMFWSFALPEQFQAPMILIVYGALYVVVYRLLRLRPPQAGMLALMGAGPLSLAAGVSLAWQPVLLFRGLVGSAPFVYMAVAWVFSTLNRRKRWYMALLVAPAIVAGLTGYYLYNPVNKGHTTEWITWLESQWLAGDVVLSVNDNADMALELYAPDLPRYRLAPCGTEAIGSLSATTRRALGWFIADLATDLYPRTWIVYPRGPVSPQCTYDAIAPLIERSLPEYVILKDEFVNAGIYLYER